MKAAFPESMVSGYESLIAAMPNDAKDRHVAAAAVKAGAQAILTFNTKDFSALPEGVEVQSPATFLNGILELDSDGLIDLLRAQAGALKRPAKTLDQLLDGLAKTVPGFVANVRSRLQHDGSRAGTDEVG